MADSEQTVIMARTIKHNMELWSQVCETDPETTQKVAKIKGGFTAICAQSQAKRATEMWGPYGTAWGMKNLNWECVVDAENEVLESILSAMFFWPGGEFEISSDIAWKAGNDTRKKLLTDCRSKALSLLGFNADVFEGKFDDNKYIESQRRKSAKKSASVPKEKAEDEYDEKVEVYKNITRYANTCGVSKMDLDNALDALAAHEGHKKMGDAPLKAWREWERTQREWMPDGTPGEVEDLRAKVDTLVENKKIDSKQFDDMVVDAAGPGGLYDKMTKAELEKLIALMEAL